MSMITPMMSENASVSSACGHDLGMCNHIGWPPQDQPSPPFIPNPPSPQDLIPCVNGWAYFWTNTHLGNFWMFIRKVVIGTSNEVVGCVLLQDQSGQPRYYIIEINLEYITSHLCNLQDIYAATDYKYV
ncbi:hypothetical protein [Paenibacillus apiarius]|uniref:Uncharacterized protein n=1 Tax=Paenibacillus apiarius TaxID=46240 RepID=A0ABT4DMD3_9BACL|nr:hypothetical protein [Paenibacillus apiarius]MCY9516024.1 hypothetical protein [Paenibacillus apiarius]MCY9518517.1 hypothetical protein [Paenibacillus apiarius]MCY9551082.1 hypothetical protein [Paenibacillus apiarius]MCY9558236.1 hypothetical protein [Paenibacillus apiarius]MCY9684636.1 hypothetical protein [Paenibacillus apiarius]